MLFKRLEQICYCIEKGEWCAKKYTKLAESNPDSRSSTPTGLTPRPELNDYVLNTTEAQARLYQVALARSRGSADYLHRGYSDYSDDMDEDSYQRTSWAEVDHRGAGACACWEGSFSLHPNVLR